MIKEITTYIENNTSFMIDTDLFAGHRPPSAPHQCVTILENSGGKVDSYLPDSGEKLIQVLTRAKTFFTARDNAYTIFDFLKSKSQITLPVVGGPTYIVSFIEAIHWPQSIGQDEGRSWEFSTNYIFRIREQ